MDFLTSQNLPLPINQQQQEQQRQCYEQVSIPAGSDLDRRVHTDIAMQLEQQYPSLLCPGHFATPIVLSLSWPNSSSHIPGYSSDLTMAAAAGAEARAQIAFDNENNSTSASRPSSSHYPLAPMSAKRAVTAASLEEEGRFMGPLLFQVVHDRVEHKENPRSR